MATRSAAARIVRRGSMAMWVVGARYVPHGAAASFGDFAAAGVAARSRSEAHAHTRGERVGGAVERGALHVDAHPLAIELEPEAGAREGEVELVVEAEAEHATAAIQASVHRRCRADPGALQTAAAERTEAHHDRDVHGGGELR